MATLKQELNLNPPCVGCGFNQPISGDACCTFGLHGFLECPNLTPPERERANKRLVENREKYGPTWDQPDPLSDGILAVMRLNSDKEG